MRVCAGMVVGQCVAAPTPAVVNAIIHADPDLAKLNRGRKRESERESISVISRYPLSLSLSLFSIL